MEQPNESGEKKDEIVVDSTAIPDDIETRPKWFMNLSTNQQDFLSPINISIAHAHTLELKPLNWSNFNVVPNAALFTNTGYTLLLSARYSNDKPYITSGPLTKKYFFSQIHFHWGRNDMEGSEHSVDGVNHPLEMHVIYYNEKYGSQENAIQHKDGLCILVYFYKLEDIFNNNIQKIIDYIPQIRNARDSVKIKKFPLVQTLMQPFDNDYLLYWGSVIAKGQIYPLIWIICREPFPITVQQMEQFRVMYDINGDRIKRNFHTIFPRDDRRIFHVNPSSMLYTTLYPLPYDPPKNKNIKKKYIKGK